MSDDEDQPDEVSERLGDEDFLSLFDSKPTKSTQNYRPSSHGDDVDEDVDHSFEAPDNDDRGRFLQRREDNSFDYSVDEDRLVGGGGGGEESSPMHRQQRQFADEENDEDSRLSLRNIDEDVEEPPPLPPAEKRFAIDELPVLLKRLKLFADENLEKQRRILEKTSSETIEEVRRKAELEAFVKMYKKKIDVDQNRCN